VPNVTLEVDTLARAGGKPQKTQRAVPRVAILEDNSLEVRGEDFTGTIDSSRKHARVRQPADERFPVEAMVRLILADYLLSQGGLLVHSVALAHGALGAVFSGASGAGKSTLAGLATSTGMALLADELVAVRPEGESYFAHGTPWNTGSPKTARIIRFGVLAFADESRIERIPSSDVLRVLLSNVLLPDESPNGRSRCFQVASQLLRDIACVRLHFAVKSSVADVLRRELESA
jgi:hypothetical protein